MKKIRKLSRLGNEFHLNASMAVLDWVPDSHDQAVVALLVLSRCVDDWCDGEAIRRPKRLTRAISVRAVARSLHAANATIQRHVARLIERGVLVDLPDGVAIDDAPGGAEAVVATLTTAHDSFLRLIEAFAADVPFQPPQQSSDRLTGAVLGMALNAWLVPFEVARSRVVDWTSGLVWLAIVVANVRHVTADPALSERYAEAPTPDDLRRPINVRALAAMTGLTYGTVYRHCQRLAAADVIEYDRGGWLTTALQVNDQQVDDGVRALLGYYVQHIRELVARGLDVSAVADRYLVGPPAYVMVPD